MRRRLLALAAAAALAVAFVAPANGGTAVMVGGIPNVGPHADGLCGGDLTPFSADGPLFSGFGASSFVVGDTQVGGTLNIRGGRPNTEVEVRLIQRLPMSMFEECFIVNAYASTDAAGNLNIYVREPRSPYATGATFFVMSRELIGYRAIVSYMTARPVVFEAQAAPPIGPVSARARGTLTRR